MTSVDKIARELHDLRRDVQAVSTQPRLRRSSIDGGALEVRDSSGATTAIIGQQYDGTYTTASVGGTFPVAPTMPLVTPAIGGLRIYWDGTYVDGSPTRMDFKRVTFHAVTDADDLDILNPGQIVGEVSIATGGEKFASLPAMEFFIFAVVWTEAGKFSVESDAAYGTPLAVVTDGLAPATAPVVTGQPGYGSVFLDWDEVTNPDLVTYEIAAKAGSGAFTPVGGDIISTTLATGANVKAAALTSYRVRAVDEDGAGPWSDQINVTPVAPLDQAALDAALEGVQTDLEGLETDLGVVQGTLSGVVTDLNTAESTLADVAADLVAAETTLAGIPATITAVADDLATVETNLGTVASDLDTAEATLATAQTNITAAQTAASNAATAASTADGKAVAAQTAADTAASAAATAAGIANGKGVVLFQTSTPSAGYELATTLWVDTTGGANTPKRWSGSAWVAVTDKAATDAAAAAAAAQTTANNAATAASTAQTTANGKNKVTYSTAAPGSTANTAGDVWFRRDGTTGRIIEQYEGTGGTSWTQRVLDGLIIAAIDAGTITTGTLSASRIAAGSLTISQTTGLQTALDAKTKTFAQNGIPTSVAAGDLWVDTDDSNKLYRAFAAGVTTIGGAAWVLVNDPTTKTTTFAQNGIPTSIAAGDLWVDTDDSNKLYRAAAAGVSTIAGGAWVLVTDPTAKTKTFAQTSIPTSVAAGDLWVDTDDSNKLYRAFAAGVTTIGGAAWVLVNDPTTKTTTFAQTSIPTSVTAGDLWVDTDDGNKLYRAAAAGVSTIAGGAWVLVQDSAAYAGTKTLVDGWVFTGQTTIDGGRIQADTITAAQIVAGAITTSELAALSVTAAKIVAGTITANEIAANTITAAKIAADTITANEIAANAVTVNELAANSVTAAKIVAATITGDRIAANTITAANITADTITAAEIAALTITAGELAANSVTAAKIVAATITGDKIAANTITADNIAADTITANEIEAGYVYTGVVAANQILTGSIEANLAIVGEIATAASGRRISISSAGGLKAVDPSGDIIAQIPTAVDQDITMQADLVAKSITALGSVAMRAANNELAQASTLILRGATAAPVTPPTVSIDWAALSGSTDDAPYTGWYTGTHHDPGSDRIYRGYQAWGYSGVQWLNPDTGALIGSLGIGDPSTGNGANVAGAYRSGANIYALVQLSGSAVWSLRRYNATTLAYIGEWTFASPFLDSAYWPVITSGASGNAVIVYHSTSTGVLIRAVRNQDSGAVVVTESMGAASALAGTLRGVYEGGADIGTIGVWIHTDAVENAVLCFTPSAGTYIRNANYEFPTPYGHGLSGMVYDSTDGIFKTQDRTSGIWYKHAGAGHAWTTESSTWFVTNTWRDNDSTGGTHETVQGPPAVITMKKRAILNVTTPPIPVDANSANHDDPNAVSIYVGRTDGGRTTQFRQAAPATEVRNATLNNIVFSNADTLHPNPPSNGDFPNLTPARVSDSTGAYFMDGNGDFNARKMLATNVGRYADYTPGLVGIAFSSYTARWARSGNMVTVKFSGNVSAVNSNGIQIGIPVNSASAGASTVVSVAGNFLALRQGVAWYTGAAYLATTTSIAFIRDNTGGTMAGTNLAAGDALGFTITYEAAATETI